MVVQRLQMDGHCVKLDQWILFVVLLWSWPRRFAIIFKIPWQSFLYKSRFLVSFEKKMATLNLHSCIETVSWSSWCSASPGLSRPCILISPRFSTCFLTCKALVGTCVCDLCVKVFSFLWFFSLYLFVICNSASKSLKIMAGDLDVFIFFFFFNHQL